LNNVVANHVCQHMDNIILCENPIVLWKVQRDKVAYAITLTVFMSDHLIRTSSSFRQIVFEKFFNHIKKRNYAKLHTRSAKRKNEPETCR
jgi:hypothetical protein